MAIRQYHVPGVIIIIVIINRRFKDAQLTKNVTKAPAVTTVQNKAKLSSKQHCLQALSEHVETERWVPKAASSTMQDPTSRMLAVRESLSGCVEETRSVYRLRAIDIGQEVRTPEHTFWLSTDSPGRADCRHLYVSRHSL